MPASGRLIAANGVAAILFGFVLVLWPDIGLTTIVAVVAVYALVRGVLSGMAAFSAPLPRAERGWLTLEAVAGTAIGIALLVWNDISAQALLYVVAAWAIAIGVLMLAAAIQLPLSGGRRLRAPLDRLPLAIELAAARAEDGLDPTLLRRLRGTRSCA